MNDNQLIEGILKQDHKVLAQFYEANVHVVQQWARSAELSEQDAEDIYQDGFVALYLNLKKNKFNQESGAKLSTYFLQICKFKLLDFKKSAHHKRVGSINTIEESIKTDDDALHGLMEAEKMKQIHLIIDELGEKCKQIIRLFYWEKESLSKIAETVGLTSASVKNSKYRCMNQLKSLFLQKKWTA